MRRMLDPTKVGGLPSTIEFDQDGNRTADKDLKVNGKLKLQSLVSNTNPDGDITKELGGGGGGELYCHCIIMEGRISTNYYNNSKTPFTFKRFRQAITDNNKNISCSGVAKNNNQYYIAISRYEFNNFIWVYYLDTASNSIQSEQFSTDTSFADNVIKVI